METSSSAVIPFESVEATYENYTLDSLVGPYLLRFPPHCAA